MFTISRTKPPVTEQPIESFAVSSRVNTWRSLTFRSTFRSSQHLLRIEIPSDTDTCLTLSREDVVDLRDALTEVLDRGFA